MWNFVHWWLSFAFYSPFRHISCILHFLDIQYLHFFLGVFFCMCVMFLLFAVFSSFFFASSLDFLWFLVCFILFVILFYFFFFQNLEHIACDEVLFVHAITQSWLSIHCDCTTAVILSINSQHTKMYPICFSMLFQIEKTTNESIWMFEWGLIVTFLQTENTTNF